MKGFDGYDTNERSLSELLEADARGEFDLPDRSGQEPAKQPSKETAPEDRLF